MYFSIVCHCKAIVIVVEVIVVCICIYIPAFSNIISSCLKLTDKRHRPYYRLPWRHDSTLATRRTVFMATHGSVGEFNPDREDWISYTERLTQYFVANGISAEEGDKRKAILLSSCGAATYQLIRNLAAPNKPANRKNF